MSDLLDSAAAALGIPTALAQRSAAARAAETGSSVDDILSAWGGGAPVPVTTPPAELATVAAPAAAEEPAVAAVAVTEAPVIATPAVPEIVVEEEPEEPLEPVALGRRLRIATRIGTWTGAGLGLVGFLVASAFWSDTASVLPDTGPIVQVNSTGVLIGAALISLLFGAIVAGFSRAGASWANPAMQLANSKASTAWVGGIVGLVVGLLAGSVLTDLGTSIDAGEETLVQLPVLATLAVMVIGGGILGALTAAIPQLFGTPVAVDEDDQKEVAEVKGRLGSAVSIPVLGLMLLLVLVLPFAFLLIRSNEMASGAAALIAVLVAGGILGFATLAGSKPEMRISFSDVLVALAGLGTLIVIIVMVIVFNTSEDEHDDGEDSHAAAVVQVI